MNEKDFTLPEGVQFNRGKDVLSISRILSIVEQEADIDKQREISLLMDKYTKDEQDRQALRESLDHLLEETWKSHRSYKLMHTDDIEKRLFPNIKEATQFEALGKKKDDDMGSPVWSIIRASWNEEVNHPIMIQGKGGIGKTVTLFSLTNMDKNTIPAPAVYVPMFDLIDQNDKVINLTDYFQSAASFSSLPKKQCDGICDLATKPWDNGPSLLVLLDGFNEVPGARRWDVLQMLREWHKTNCGAQLIAVSRPMDNLSLVTAFGNETISIALSELTKESVTAYLKSPRGEGVRLPDPDAPIWETIVYPLFLNLYIKADRLRDQQAWKDYPLDVREAAGPGSIIWNYLQRELLRQEDDKWILRCAAACEYIAPILAHHMLQNYDYTISQLDAITVIQQAISEMDLNRMPAHLADIFSWWKTLELSAEPPVFLKELNWPDIVLRESGLLVPYQGEKTKNDKKNSKKKQEPRFEFLHQNFRDCLAGIYLVNQAEMERENEFPEIWSHNQNHLALNYAAELIDSVLFKKLWEANREVQKHSIAGCRNNHTATFNLLDLCKRNKNLPQEPDFSGMNLHGLPLTRYLGKVGKTLPLFQNRALSKETELDRSVFESVGHSQIVVVLSVLPDGRVVSGSWDYTLRVWDAATGECQQTLEGHKDFITCVAVLPDGRVVSGSKDRTLCVWDATTGECVQTLEGHTDEVTCVGVLPDGRVVSGSWDNTLRMWDADTGQCLQTLEGHTSTVSCLAVLLDGRLVSGSGMLGGDDFTLRVWDATTGGCQQILKGHLLPISCVAVLSDGRVVSGSWDHTLRVWDAATGECQQILEGHEGRITCVSVLPDGRVVSGSDSFIGEDYTLKVWDAATGECLQTLEGHEGSIECVAVFPDGRVASGSSDSTLRVWDADTGQCLQTLEGHKSAVYCLAVLLDGRLVSGSQDRTLRMWDAATRECQQTLEGSRRVIGCVAVLPDGRVVSGSEDRTLCVWDADTGQCQQTLEGHRESITCTAVLADGRVVSGSEDCTLRVWDADTGQCQQTLEGHTSTVTCVAVLADGRVVSGSWDRTLRVWDAATGECQKILEGHKTTINSVAVLPDGRVVSGAGGFFGFGSDYSLRVWDPATGECTQTLDGYKGKIECVTTLPDGRVVSVTIGNTLLVLDFTTGECQQIREGHEGMITCITVLPDGRVVSGSEDRTLWVLDATTGECQQILEGHEGRITCAAVLPDGRVVSGSSDGTMRVWNPENGECLDTLEATEIDVSSMKLQDAILTDDLARLLWHNRAEISDSDYKQHVEPFRKSFDRNQ